MTNVFFFSLRAGDLNGHQKHGVSSGYSSIMPYLKSWPRQVVICQGRERKVKNVGIYQAEAGQAWGRDFVPKTQYKSIQSNVRNHSSHA